MDERAEILNQLSEAARKGSGFDVQQFREDWKVVLQTWRDHGEMSQDEYEKEYSAQAQVIRDHLHNTEWMVSASRHFHDIAERMRMDKARSERIAAEVRAEQ